MTKYTRGGGRQKELEKMKRRAVRQLERDEGEHEKRSPKR